MTDDTVRPESNPTREPRPGGPEEGVADEAAAQVGDVAEPTPGAVDDAAADAEGAVAESNATVEPAGVVGEAHAANAGAASELREETLDDTPEGASAPDAVTDAAATEAVPDDAVAEADAASAPDVALPDEPAAPEVVAVEGEGEPVEAVAPESVEEPVTPPSVAAAPGDQRSDTFTWHPDHRGKTFDEVRAALAQEIAADQRQHRLAMEGAEESEQEALASVVGLERKWGKYDFDWAEQEPDALADRIVDFERERERRRQMISWSEYRDGDVESDEALVAGERPAELSSSAKGLSLLLVVLLIVVILLAVWAL